MSDMKWSIGIGKCRRNQVSVVLPHSICSSRLPNKKSKCEDRIKETKMIEMGGKIADMTDIILIEPFLKSIEFCGFCKFR